MTNKLSPVLYLAAALLLGVLWLSWCHDPAVRKEERDMAAGRATDSSAAVTDRRVAELAQREIARESTLARTGRELASARTEVARLKNQKMTLPENVNDSVLAVVANRDSVIVAQDIVILAQDSSLTIWTARAEERGALLTRALNERDAFKAQRDAWQHRAERRFACVGGPAIVGSLGGKALAGVGVACGIRL